MWSMPMAFIMRKSCSHSFSPELLIPVSVISMLTKLPVMGFNCAFLIMIPP